MTIKAIDTRYRGHLFRSRLEARWAVFFDHLGIAWQYEPEGYELNDGTWYLPDFYLPDFERGCWVEVKAKHGDWRKAAAFSYESGQNVWLADGSPCDHAYDVLHGPHPETPNPHRNFMDPSQDPDGDLELHIYFDMSWSGVPLASEADGENRMYAGAEVEAMAHGWSIEQWINEMAPHVARARDAARSARFEHGDAPAARRP